MIPALQPEPIFLKIKGGWLNPRAIKFVETHPQNAAMLLVGLEGKDRPIVLNEADSAYVNEYLDSRTWPKASEPTGFVEDAEGVKHLDS